MNCGFPVWRALIVVAAALLPASAVLADGCYFPPPSYPRLPEIPGQRAMISWRDGSETLVVESSMDSAAQEFGWVLPLPAEPTDLRVADGGMLVSMAMSQRPEVHGGQDRTSYWLGLLFVLLLPVAAVVIFAKDNQDRRRGLTNVACVYVMLLLLSSLMMSSLAYLGGANVATVSISAEKRVGSYDVTVLRAPDAAALTQWLRDNALSPLDARGQAIAADYVAAGWCFVVARLRRDEGGAATPHPIAATFPADRAVYPMKLTQLAGSTTHVQLFVVANRQARADGFRVAAADRYRKLPGIEPIAPGPYRGESTSLVIGSPDAGDLLWDSCVVTTLTADVPPQAMDRDVELSFGDLDPYRDCVYSVAGRNDLALSILFGGGTLVVACCMLAFGDRRKSRRIDRRVIAALIVLTLIASVGVRLLLSAVDVHVSRRWHDRWWLTTMEDVAYELVEDGVLRSDMTLGELADFPRLAVERRRAVEEELLNPYTGEPMKCERSPGNFSMRKGDDDLAYFCFYDVNGCERRVPLFRPPPKILPDD